MFTEVCAICVSHSCTMHTGTNELIKQRVEWTSGAPYQPWKDQQKPSKVQQAVLVANQRVPILLYGSRMDIYSQLTFSSVSLAAGS